MPDVNPFDFDIKELIRNCEFGSNPVVTRVYYPANELFKVQADEKGSARQASAEESEVDED
jgi:hypothetical protein